MATLAEIIKRGVTMMVTLGGATNSNGDNAANVVGEFAYIGGLPPSWLYNDGATLSASASVVSATVSDFIPYDTLTFTESGGGNPVTFKVRLRGSSRGTLEITGTGTLDIFGTLDGVTSATEIQVETAAGVKQIANNLVAGLYYIEV